MAKIQFVLVLITAVPQFFLLLSPFSMASTGFGFQDSLSGLFILAYMGIWIWVSWLIRGALLEVADGLDDLKAVRQSLGV